MNEVNNCTVNKEYDNIDMGTGKKAKIEKHLRSIDLKFGFKNNEEPISTSFYRSNVNSIYETAESEVKAKEWEAVVLK